MHWYSVRGNVRGFRGSLVSAFSETPLRRTMSPRTSSRSVLVADEHVVRRSPWRSQIQFKCPLSCPKEIQKRYASELTGCIDAQQDQVLTYPRLRSRSAHNVAKKYELLDCVLCVVVVPRYSVIVQEREESVSILLKPLTPRFNGLGFPVRAG